MQYSIGNTYEIPKRTTFLMQQQVEDVKIILAKTNAQSQNITFVWISWIFTSGY